MELNVGFSLTFREQLALFSSPHVMLNGFYVESTQTKCSSVRYILEGM